MLDNQDFKLDGFYTVNEEGILTDEKNDTHTISTSGTTPNGGYLGIENNEVVYECLNIGDYKVTLEGGTVTAEKGKCGEVKPFKVGDSIYFNPGSSVEGVTDSVGKCDKEYYSADNTNSGCMKWYVLNGTGTSVDLLLDHNTTKLVAWLSFTDSKETNSETIKNEYGITYPNNQVPNVGYPSHSKGPLTILKQLKLDTENWSDSLIRNDSYSVNIPNASYEQVNYTIDYSGYKAKMVTPEEIAKITGQKNTNLQNLTEFSLGENYNWMKDNTGTDNRGYWTSSPVAGFSGHAWYVSSDGLNFAPIPDFAIDYGLRPVITVLKSQIIQ